MQNNLYITLKNGKFYHTGILADNILNKNPGIRETPEYRSLEDRYFDYTSACNKKEQQDWMCYYMSKAIEQDIAATHLMSRGMEHWAAAQGMKFDAALQFIVAFDLIAE